MKTRKSSCKFCNKIFYSSPSARRKFCCYHCKSLAMKGQIAWNKGKKCPQWSGKKHWDWKGGLIKKTCKVCGKVYEIPRCRDKKTKYCSKKCSDKMNLPHCGKTNHMWNGGQFKKKSGYVLILFPSHPFCDCRGYVRRSRLVMENHIGRYLTREEVVHHINRIKDDDRIENLVLFSNNFEHVLHHIELCKAKKYTTNTPVVSRV